MLRSSYALFCLLLSAAGLVHGQEYVADTAFVADAQKSAVKLYTSRLGVVSNVYNGNEYSEYRPQDSEHPYLTQDWTYGIVDYGGERYESVPLLLDISNDQLITVYTYGNAIQMISEKVRSFQLDNRTFVRLSDSKLTPGFYERMYNGKVQYYARRQKQLYVRLDGTKLKNTFETSNNYYIAKDGVYHSFKTKGALLKIFGDRKAELKKFIRDQRIPFGADRERSAQRVVAYYDQITR